MATKRQSTGIPALDQALGVGVGIVQGVGVAAVAGDRDCAVAGVTGLGVTNAVAVHIRRRR